MLKEENLQNNDINYQIKQEIDETSKQIILSKPLLRCFKLLNKLKNKQNSFLFSSSDSNIETNCSVDNNNKIMDLINLNEIEINFNMGYYKSIYMFANDCRLMWANSFKYNSNNAKFYKITLDMSN